MHVTGAAIEGEQGIHMEDGIRHTACAIDEATGSKGDLLADKKLMQRIAMSGLRLKSNLSV